MRYGVLLITFFLSSLLFAAPSLKVAHQELRDSVITAKIDAKLAKHRKMNPLKLHVSTTQGIVSLKGAVPDKNTLVEVLRLVKQTKGVKGINIEHLKTQVVNTAVTDTYITAKVEAAILKAKVLDDESIPLVGINARTENGKVTLSGVVKHQHSIAYIVKRVSEVRGVKSVLSNIKVASGLKGGEHA